jgi:hypothetical protein
MSLKMAILPMIVFLVVANPKLFVLVRSVLGKWVASPEGLPTMAGLLLHSIVFVLLMHFLWKIVYGSKTSNYSRRDMRRAVRQAFGKSNYMSTCEGADVEGEDD